MDEATVVSGLTVFAFFCFMNSWISNLCHRNCSDYPITRSYHASMSILWHMRRLQSSAYEARHTSVCQAGALRASIPRHRRSQAQSYSA
jgi:hypothetical protein